MPEENSSENSDRETLVPFLLLLFYGGEFFFYAVLGYHLRCDDVGFAGDINIHTLCKQRVSAYERNERNSKRREKHFMQINWVRNRQKAIRKKTTKK